MSAISVGLVPRNSTVRVANNDLQKRASSGLMEPIGRDIRSSKINSSGCWISPYNLKIKNRSPRRIGARSVLLGPMCKGASGC